MPDSIPGVHKTILQGAGISGNSRSIQSTRCESQMQVERSMEPVWRLWRNLRKGSSRFYRKWCVVTLLFLLFPLVCHCHLSGAHKTLLQVRDEIQAAEGSEMGDTSLYHLAAAKGLLAAAEKQYEDADFTAALKFARRAQDQVERARRLQAFHEQADSLKTRGDP